MAIGLETDIGLPEPLTLGKQQTVSLADTDGGELRSITHIGFEGPVPLQPKGRAAAMIDEVNALIAALANDILEREDSSPANSHPHPQTLPRPAA